MAQVHVHLMILRKRWFFWPALLVIGLAGKFGLIRDKNSAEHFGGRITGEERAAKWIAEHAMRIEVR